MSKNESNPESDPLSATGMFLRALGSKDKAAENASAPTNAGAAGPSGTGGPIASGQVPAAAAESAGGQAGPGEFTRLFQARAMDRPAGESSAADARGAGETASAPAGERAAVAPETPMEPGEFTRVFLSGSARGAVPAKAPDDGQRTRVPAGGAGRAKGFSSPGTSDSASAEGGVTQLFRPVAPARAGQDTPGPEAASGAASRPSASASITNLIESLASPGGSPREAERPLYPSAPPASPSSGGPGTGGPATGGVTQMIEKLAEEASRPAQAGPVAAAPSLPVGPAGPETGAGAGAGPGEYTRVIARVAEPAASAARAAAAAAVPVAQIPAAPKPAGPPMPAFAAPRTKLEAMAPALLAINTVLLVAVLAVLLLLLHAK